MPLPSYTISLSDDSFCFFHWFFSDDWFCPGFNHGLPDCPTLFMSVEISSSFTVSLQPLGRQHR